MNDFIDPFTQPDSGTIKTDIAICVASGVALSSALIAMLFGTLYHYHAINKFIISLFL